MITDRMRLTVIEANTDVILTRDLVTKDLQVTKNLSGPSTMEFKVPQTEQGLSAYGIHWKNYGQTVVAELEFDGDQQVFAFGLVTDNKVDPTSGDLAITCTGILGYPKTIPFLVNLNPIAIDPFEIVQRVWGHLQSYSNANLEVLIEPTSSGTQMLPGYSFDGNTLSFDFFAVFFRAIDMDDCADIINGLARDIPFDMIEVGAWNPDRTVFERRIHLGYPLAGVEQDYLTFRLGENVIQAQKADERDIEPVSDVIIRGWLPGQVVSSELSNEDPTRYRRTVLEDDAQINSTERAAAWAKRKLTRRNIPLSFQKIWVDPNHPAGPLGRFDLGDSLWVSAQNYPWYGTIEGWHRVTSITYTEAQQGGGPGGKQGGGSAGVPPGIVEVGLKVEGAFNYDPITYNPDTSTQPVVDPNRLANGYFAADLSGWTAVKGQWIRVADITYDTPFAPDAGSVRIDCDDHGEAFLSHRCNVTPGETLTVECVVQYENVTVTAGTPTGTPGFILRGFTSLNADPTPGETIDFAAVIDPAGVVGWQLLRVNSWTVPTGINEVALQLTVADTIASGTAFWTFVRIYPTGDVITGVPGQ